MAWLREVHVSQVDLVPRGALRDPDDPSDTAKYLMMKSEERPDHTEFRAHEHSHGGKVHMHAHSHQEGDVEHEGTGHGHLAKRDFDPNVGGGVDRDTLPAEDFAGKNRSYPIVTPQDVQDAADSIGRAGSDNYDSKELRANITRIAHRKGPEFVAKLPKAWRMSKEEAVSFAKAALAAPDSRGLPHDVVEALASLSDGGPTNEEHRSMPDEDLAKAEKPTASNPDPDGDGDNDLTASGDTDHDYWNADGTPTAKGASVGFKAKVAKEEGVVTMAKEEFEAMEQRLAKAEELAKAERNIRLDREFLAKAETMPHLPGIPTSELGQVLRQISEAAPEAFAKLEAVLTGAETALAKSEFFGERGSAAAKGGSALGQLQAQAAVIAKEESLPQAKAMSEAQRRFPDLYQQYRTEQRAAARMN